MLAESEAENMQVSEMSRADLECAIMENEIIDLFDGVDRTDDQLRQIVTAWVAEGDETE